MSGEGVAVRAREQWQADVHESRSKARVGLSIGVPVGLTDLGGTVEIEEETMSEAPLRALFEFFYSMFPVPFFLQLLEVLAAVINTVFGTLGVDFKVVAF